MSTTLDRYRTALAYIPPDLPHDEWVRIGMAAREAGLSFDDFNGWSARADNYRQADVQTAWRSFKTGRGVGPGTLVKAAIDHGMPPGAHMGKVHSTKAPPREVAPFKTARSSASAIEVWERCTPATGEHPYIVAKEGVPHGLRVLPADDTLTIAGQRMAGALVVPVLPLGGGDPVSLQVIPAPGCGKKMNLPGASMNGIFVVGKLESGCAVYVCEGIGQAWACWKATGSASVVCFGWGRVRGVALALRKRDAAARIVVVPDVGKEPEAESVAREMRGAFVSMPEGWERNSDVNDYARREGVDALEVMLSRAGEPARPETRFKLLSSADIHALPPLTWRIRGVLPAQGIASVFGPSASGKSFLALDMAAAIAEGREWFGYRVAAAPVVYVALEGTAGFRLRVEAWERHHGRPLPPGLRLVLQQFKLTEVVDVDDMAEAVCSAGADAVTFIDTLNASAPGIDENASKDMGRVLEAAKTLQALTGGVVTAVHHTGKDPSKGLRGHSSLFAALDAAIEVARDGERRSWIVAKAKDGADGTSHPFRLAVVELAPDSDGDPRSSCVIRKDTTLEDVRQVKLPQGGNQKLVLDTLRPMFKGGPTGKPGAPIVRPCVELEAAVIAGAGRLTCQSDKRTSRAREAITGLITRGILGLNEGWLWLV